MFSRSSRPQAALRQLEAPPDPQPKTTEALTSLGTYLAWTATAFFFLFLLLMMTTMSHWRRKWQPTPVFLPGESQGQGSLVGCRLRGHTESDTTEVT